MYVSSYARHMYIYVTRYVSRVRICVFTFYRARGSVIPRKDITVTWDLNGDMSKKIERKGKARARLSRGNAYRVLIL